MVRTVLLWLKILRNIHEDVYHDNFQDK